MDPKIIQMCYCVLILIQAICEALLDRVPEEESATKTMYVHVCVYVCVCGGVCDIPYMIQYCTYYWVIFSMYHWYIGW